MTVEAPARSRTIAWEDPIEAFKAGAGLSGLAYMRGIAERRIAPPPVALLLGMDILEVEPGRAVFTLEPGEHLYNPIGMVHGGIVSTLLDSAMGCAVHASLPDGVAYTTLELKVNFVRAVGRDTGTLRCEGTVIHVGRTTATAEGRIVDGAGKLYAHATTTCLILGGAR
jgi:uncharacterized protein (TIGR00369 family)